MSIPDAAVSILLENLTQILKFNSQFIADVRGRVVELHQELQNLRGAIKDYNDSKYINHAEKELGVEIRGVVHGAEDVVETYIVLQAAAEESREWIFEAFQIMDYQKKLQDSRKEIQEIGEKVVRINREKANSGYETTMQDQEFVIVNPDRDERPAKPKKAPKVDEEQIIGFDGAVEEVSKLLVGGAEQFEAISIVGMIGHEKTTLAKKVLKDSNVDYEFMIRAFIHVSKEYDKRDVLLQILSSLRRRINPDVNTMSEDQLEKHVHQQLQGKRYLIILDNVFEEEDWIRLKHVFPRNNKRCRVLITTYNAKLAEKLNPEISFYSLDFLSADKSLELFRRKVFGDNNCSKELQLYETQILEKCGGFPLAIVIIAGIVWSHRTRVDWWKYVADSVKDYNGRDQEQITKIMELMYSHLPDHLKPCLIYLGVFRENFEIPVWKLLQLWIAEGLIQQEEEDSDLDDVAEEYLQELVCRNLVMVGKRRSNGKIKTCRIHDQLLEFYKKKAKQDNLFQEITQDNLYLLLSGNEASDQYRRLCINNVNIQDYISKRLSGNSVRSFLTFQEEEETIVEPKFVNSIPKAFKLLRVLEIESFIFTRFPVDLRNLVLLKYIAISSSFSALPSVMSALLNLQILIVNTSSPVLDIKADIWKMGQLRHVHTNSSTNLLSPDAKNQKTEEGFAGANIQTLATISPESCRKEIFYHTPKLKKLGIFGALTRLFEVNGESSFFGNIGELESLENLKLLNDDLTSTLYSLPLEKSFPKKLTKLTLENTLLDWKEMGTLGKLENLEVLKLKNYACEGKLWKTEKGGFRGLQYLHIGQTDLVIWEASSADHFPKLKCLDICHCNQLRDLPQGLADIPSFQSVVLHCTNLSLVSSAAKLQKLKLEQAQNDNNIGKFKLFIYPPDHRF